MRAWVRWEGDPKPKEGGEEETPTFNSYWKATQSREELWEEGGKIGNMGE